MKFELAFIHSLTGEMGKRIEALENHNLHNQGLPLISCQSVLGLS
jgi:hypothetical protein